MVSDKSIEHKKSALAVATDKVPRASSSATVGEVVNLLNTEKPDQYDSVNYIYVVSDRNNLKGIVSVKEIFRNPNHTKLSEIMTTALIAVRSHSPQEKAALLAVKNNIKAVPVVDKEDKFLGVITSATILNILHKEHVEDMLHSAGVGELSKFSADLTSISIFQHIKVRLPWLVIGLGGGILAASIVSGFDKLIEELILLAAFLPAIVYIGDAVGAQTQTIIIRSLAFDNRLPILKYIGYELTISLFIGTIIGIMAGVVSQIFWGSSTLALIVSISFFLTIILSSIVAIILPLLFSKFKIDPAVGSGPLATVIRDILSILVYFTVASFFIGNLTF